MMVPGSQQQYRELGGMVVGWSGWSALPPSIFLHHTLRINHQKNPKLREDRVATMTYAVLPGPLGRAYVREGVSEDCGKCSTWVFPEKFA